MKLLATAICAIAFALPAIAHAQTPPAQPPAIAALSSCIQRSTTAADNLLAARWVFVAMSHHPSVAELASVPAAQMTAVNREMAGLFNRLLLQECPNETRAALRAHGEAALDVPFSLFGERAMQELMSHPNVNAGVEEMTSFFDTEGLARLILTQ